MLCVCAYMPAVSGLCCSVSSDARERSESPGESSGAMEGGKSRAGGEGGGGGEVEGEGEAGEVGEEERETELWVQIERQKQAYFSSEQLQLLREKICLF